MKFEQDEVSITGGVRHGQSQGGPVAIVIVVGGLGGLLVVVVRRNARGRVPYGPFMLIGAALSVVLGPWLAQSLGY